MPAWSTEPGNSATTIGAALRWAASALAAVADRPAVDALVPTDDRAVKDEVARRRQRHAARRDPADVVLVRDEADFHAGGLVRDRQIEALRERADFLLVVGAERHSEARGLLAPEAAEHVALVVFRAAF